MSDLVVLGFDHTNDATLALEECRKLQKEYLLDLEDAVVVVRDAEGKVHLHQSINLEKLVHPGAFFRRVLGRAGGASVPEPAGRVCGWQRGGRRGWRTGGQAL